MNPDPALEKIPSVTPYEAETFELLLGHDRLPLPLLLQCENGDVLSIDVLGSLLSISLDDCDATPVPTAVLTQQEILRLVAMLLRSAKHLEQLLTMIS